MLILKKNTPRKNDFMMINPAEKGVEQLNHIIRIVKNQVRKKRHPPD
jgi:hypothetical protein